MGFVQRDGIERLTHAKRYSRFKSTICVMLSDTGFKAGHGKRWGVPATEIARPFRPGRGLGHQPGQHPRQPDEPHRPRPEGARREAGRGRPLPLAHGRAGRHAPGPAPRHRRRAGLRRHARPVRARASPTATISPATATCRTSWSAICAARTPAWAAAITGLPVAGDRGLRPALRRHEAQLSCGWATASPARATEPPPCTPPPACRWSPAPGSTRAAARSTISASSTTGTRR